MVSSRSALGIVKQFLRYKMCCYASSGSNGLHGQTLLGGCVDTTALRAMFARQTGKQYQVLQYLAAGSSADEIAKFQGVTKASVVRRLKILRKTFGCSEQEIATLFQAWLQDDLRQLERSMHDADADFPITLTWTMSAHVRGIPTLPMD